MSGFAPARVPFAFRPSNPLPAAPATWVAVAGRTVVGGLVPTSAFGGGSQNYLGYYLDAANTPPGAGQVQLSTPQITLEPGHNYEVRMKYSDVNAPDFRWRSTVYTGWAGTTGEILFTILGEVGSAPIEVLSRSTANQRPWIGELVVTRLSL